MMKKKKIDLITISSFSEQPHPTSPNGEECKLGTSPLGEETKVRLLEEKEKINFVEYNGATLTMLEKIEKNLQK